MEIGFVQFAPVLGDLQATIDRIEELSSQCAGIDLLVLPELCNSGYNFTSKEQARATSEEVGSSDFIWYLESLCARLDCHIVSGLNERCGSRLYNTAVLVGPQGYVGKYRKLHLFLNEKDFFEPGDVGLPVFDIGACRIGMLVCFDWLFPEAWRVLALKEADIICHPSNLVLPGLAQQAVPVHALINRLYIVTANRIGSEGDLTYTGMSTIADPRGQVLAQASRTHPEVSRARIDINLARAKDITARNNLLTDRRPQEYQLITDQQTG